MIFIFSVFNGLLNLKNHYLNLYILGQLVDNNNNSRIKLNFSNYLIYGHVYSRILGFFLLFVKKSIQKIILMNKSFISHVCITLKIFTNSCKTFFSCTEIVTYRSSWYRLNCSSCVKWEPEIIWLTRESPEMVLSWYFAHK